MTPIVIAGITLAGSIVLGVCLWLGIHTYKTRNRTRALTAEGASDEKAFPRPRHVPLANSCSCNREMTVDMSRSTYRITVKGAPHFSRDQLTSSIILPQQNIVRPDATKDEILQYYMASGTMTRPFSMTASGGSSTLASPTTPYSAPGRPISAVSFLSAAARTPSPRRTSFFSFGGNRPMSVASSTFSAVSSVLGGDGGRKVRQLFSPVLPDELVISLGEKVTVVQSFDDGWCIVGRDSFINPGDVEMGAIPAWCFVKPVKGLKASRPMRTTSLGVTVQIESGPGFTSRDEVISWSNF